MKACASYRHHLLSTQTAETVTRGAIRRDRPALTAGAGTILYTAEIPRDTYRSTSFFILKNIYKILRYFLHLGIFFYRCFFIDGAPSPPDPRLLRTVATGDPPKKNRVLSTHEAEGHTSHNGQGKPLRKAALEDTPQIPRWPRPPGTAPRVPGPVVREVF